MSKKIVNFRHRHVDLARRREIVQPRCLRHSSTHQAKSKAFLWTPSWTRQTHQNCSPRAPETFFKAQPRARKVHQHVVRPSPPGWQQWLTQCFINCASRHVRMQTSHWLACRRGRRGFSFQQQLHTKARQKWWFVCTQGAASFVERECVRLFYRLWASRHDPLQIVYQNLLLQRNHSLHLKGLFQTLKEWHIDAFPSKPAYAAVMARGTSLTQGLSQTLNRLKKCYRK